MKVLALALVLVASPALATTTATVHGKDVTVTITSENPNAVYCEAQRITRDMDGPVSIDLPAGHFQCTESWGWGTYIGAPYTTTLTPGTITDHK